VRYFTIGAVGDNLTKSEKYEEGRRETMKVRKHYLSISLIGIMSSDQKYIIFTSI